MGAEESQLPLGSYKSQLANESGPVNCQITIALHGKRGMGKSCLINRMRNVDVSPTYTPTPMMESIDFRWNLSTKRDYPVRVILWEVVEKAIRPDDLDPEIPLPDATTVDTYTRSDGIIVLYNPDDDESAKYAVSVVNNAPDEIPILVIANFLDRRKFEEKCHPMMEFVASRIIHVQASVLGLRGLVPVAKWLDHAILFHQKQHYKSLVNSTIAEMRDLRDELRNMSGMLDASLYEARNLGNGLVMENAIPLEFRETVDVEEELEVPQKFSIRLNYD